MQALMSTRQQILSQIIANKHHTLVNDLKAAYVPAQRNELRPNNQNFSLPRFTARENGIHQKCNTTDTGTCIYEYCIVYQRVNIYTLHNLKYTY